MSLHSGKEKDTNRQTEIVICCGRFNDNFETCLRYYFVSEICTEYCITSCLMIKEHLILIGNKGHEECIKEDILNTTYTGLQAEQTSSLTPQFLHFFTLLILLHPSLTWSSTYRHTCSMVRICSKHDF